jgi:hypothetical protein
MARFCKGVRDDNLRCIKAMKDYGVKEVPVPDRTREAVEKLTKPLWNEMAGTLYPKPLLDELMANLAEYRSKKK